MFNYSVNYDVVKHNIITCRNCKHYGYLVLYKTGNIIDISVCRKCQNFLLCSQVADKEQCRKYSVKYNASVRYEPDDVELIIYKDVKTLPIRDKAELMNVSDIDHSPLFKLRDDGYFEVCKDSFTLFKFYRSIKESRRRALQTFYNYVLANTWQYFITLTFSSEYVNRYDDFEVKSCWSTFLRFLKRDNPDAKVIVVPEYHKKVNEDGKRALHFHGFLSNVPNLVFTPAYDSDGKPLYSNYSVDGKSVPRLNIRDWRYGFSTADLIVNPSNLRIANYCMKYMFKSDESLGRYKKRFFHTKNLSACYTDILNISADDLSSVVDSYNLEPVKECSNFIVYRKRKDEVPEE